jgi:hypothetical protein
MALYGTPGMAIVEAQEPRDPDTIPRELGDGPQIEAGRSAETDDEHGFAVGCPLWGHQLNTPFPCGVPPTHQNTHATKRDRAGHHCDCRGENSHIVDHRRESQTGAVRLEGRNYDRSNGECETEVMRKIRESRLRYLEIISQDEGEGEGEDRGKEKLNEQQDRLTH